MSTTSAPGARRTVLQVGTRDIGGGAEQVMMDLHELFLDRGVDSWVAVGTKHSHEPRVLEIPNDAKRSAWTRALAAASVKAASAPGSLRLAAGRALLYISDPARWSAVLSGLEDFDFPATLEIPELTPTKPDILHIHNPHGNYFDIRALPELAAKVPTVLTLHDPWILTGHCAHPFECPKWRTGCEGCPNLGMYAPIKRDRAEDNWKIKRRALAGSRVWLATESQWLADLIRQAGIFPADEVRVIPNGVDPEVFAPGNKTEARAELGLPQDRPILAFIGRGLKGSPFKDYQTLVDALPAIARSHGGDVLLLALGGGQPADLAPVSSVAEVLHVPFSLEHSDVARYLRAADVYVHASRAENLPLAVIEAMACGAPVVASRVGGIPEVVQHGVTGLLVPSGDPGAMAEAVSALLADESLRRRIAEAGAASVREFYTLNRQAQMYLDWYEEVLAQAAGAS